MKLVHKDFDLIFDFKENQHGLLIVESPCWFRKFVSDFYDEGESRFVLSDKCSIIDINKHTSCIVDFF